MTDSYKTAAAASYVTKKFAEHVSSKIPSSVEYRHPQDEHENRVILIRTEDTLFAIGVSFGEFHHVGKKIHAAASVAKNFPSNQPLRIRVIVLAPKAYRSNKAIDQPDIDVEVLAILEPPEQHGAQITQYHLDQSWENIKSLCLSLGKENHPSTVFGCPWHIIATSAVITVLCLLV
ncbi:hypothetical protein GEMRC1_000498 [Eukaryota sp. GEM-RC1]